VWVEPIEGNETTEEAKRSPPWRVTSMPVDEKGKEIGEKRTEIFDALVVCNGNPITN